jgi:two-component system, LytTR family, response regulator
MNQVDTTTLRVVIVDDESLARDRMRRLLTEFDGIVIVGEAANADEAIPMINDTRPSAVFLDVQMPGLDGFQLAESIAIEPCPYLVFVTAHASMALRAFDVAAMDFLVKPVERSRLQKTIERVMLAMRERRDDAAPSTIPEQLRALLGSVNAPVQYLERFAVTVGKRTQFVRTSDVDWFQADDNYVRIAAGQQVHLVRSTLARIEAQLDPAHFVRIHRSVIVRMDQVIEVRQLPSGELRATMPHDVHFDVARPYRDRLPGAPGRAG